MVVDGFPPSSHVLQLTWYSLLFPLSLICTDFRYQSGLKPEPSCQMCILFSFPERQKKERENYYNNFSEVFWCKICIAIGTIYNTASKHIRLTGPSTLDVNSGSYVTHYFY